MSEIVIPRYTLHLGDSLAWMGTLPDRSVDVAIFDPPYEKTAHENQRKLGEKKDGAREILNVPLPFAPITEFQRNMCAREVQRLVKRWALTFCQIEAVDAWKTAYEEAGMTWIRGGCWHKPDPTPQITGDRPGTGFECIAIVHQKKSGRMHWNGGGLPGFWSYVSKSREREWIHPTEKPLALMLKLVEQFSDEGETILDPFSGSASTGVAAIRLGRRFLGAELDPGYHAAALERLQAECLGLGLTDFRRGQQALFSAGDIAGTVRET